jgi:hypothetical protein
MPVKVFHSYGAHGNLQSEIQAWLDTRVVLEFKGMHASDLRLIIDYIPCTNADAAMPLRIELFNAKHKGEELEQLIHAWEPTCAYKVATAINEFYWFIVYVPH